MAQHDYSIANQGFPATRADINNVLSAINTSNSGTSAPSSQFAGQFWIDTTSSTWTLYIHDGSDDIQFATIDTSANTVNFIDSELGNNSVTTAKIADANVTSAKLVYPLTTFSSTGIDDNATSTAITIDSAENVGIGTASPSQALDVVGSIEVSDGIYIGGTGAANKLDDYEEGTFTPAITVASGSVTNSTQTGNYTKIGRLVYFDIRVHLTAISSPSGTLSITGLPFTGGISGRSGLIKFTTVSNFNSIEEENVLSS